MTYDTREAIYQYFLKPFLTSKSSTFTVVCDAGSQQNWREVNFGEFFSSFSLQELQIININLGMDMLAPTDVASFVTKADVLTNETLIEEYLSAITLQNITVFLEAFTTTAHEANLTEEQITTIKTTLLAVQLRDLQANFSTYKTEEWKTTFQIYLLPLTVYVNQTHLELIPLNISCSSYQAIVKAFSLQFNLMTYHTREAIYRYFLKPYLTSKSSTSTVVCDDGSPQNWREVNFGEFFSFFSLQELQIININFRVDMMAPTDVASFLTKADVLTNETLIEKYLSAITLQNITVFLEAFTTTAHEANLTEEQITTIKTTLLAVQLRDLRANFSTYTTEEWKTTFQIYLLPLAVYFNQTLLELIPLDISCSSYQVIVKTFSLQFSSMTYDTREAIYQYFLKPYLTSQSSTSIVVCDDGSPLNWREVNFGEFFSFFSLQELQIININLGMDMLAPKDVASFVTKAEFLTNETLIEEYLSAITLQNIAVFLEAFTTTAHEANLTGEQITTIKTTLLAVQLRDLQADFSTYTTEEWKTTFQIYLLPLTVYVNQTLLELIPLNISCLSYQAIVKAFSLQFSSMTNDTREAIYRYFLKRYLTSESSTSTVVCDAGSPQNWPEVNFGKFLSFFSLQELMTFNKLFSVGVLAPTDVASFVTKADVLRNETLLVEYLSVITLQNITVFLEAFATAANEANLSEIQLTTIKTTLLAVQLRGQQAEFSTYTTAQWTSLFQAYLLKLTKYLNQPLLEIIPLNMSCDSYQAIVKIFSLQTSEITGEAIYKYFIKPYLSKKSNSDINPRCYTVGNNSWMAYNLQTFVAYCTSEDLQLFSSNQTLLQQFSVDSTTLKLIGNLTLQGDFAKYYAQLLTSENSSFSLQSIPENILCYAIAWLDPNSISQGQAINTVQILRSCGANISLGQSQLAGLLSTFTYVTSENLNELGPLAVGLLPSTLQNTDGKVLLNNLQTLSSIDGWSVTQASVILSKLVQSNVQISFDKLKQLGQLVIGVQTAEIKRLQPKDVLFLAADSKFIGYIEQAPTVLKLNFVQQIIQATTNKSIFQAVPAELASEIPASNLLTNLNISEINQMKWTTNQAQVFFHTVITKEKTFSSLSVNILRGFTCGAANNLTNDEFLSLVKAIKVAAVKVDSNQVSCMAKRLTKGGTPTDFNSFPNDVLLFIGPYTSQPQCKDYVKGVGMANINLLPQGSSKRTALLSSAFVCLNISSNNLSEANLMDLGILACDLTSQEISNSNLYVLEALKNCSSFTNEQKKAIVTKLKAKHGEPSTWTLETMNQIGILSSILDGGTIKLISQSVKIFYFPRLLNILKTQDMNTFIYVINQLKSSYRISNRDAITCENNLTTAIIANQMDFIVVSYNAAQLDVCTTNETLLDSLSILGSLEFDEDQLQVLKARLDTIFPNGVPRDYLIQLGNIARVYSKSEMQQWNITSVDTLSTLIQSASWNSNDSKVSALVERYLQLNFPNASLDGTLLTILAPYICSLNQTSIQNITDDSLRTCSKPLEISTCDQSIEDLLFNKMKSTYSLYLNSSNQYFQIMKPVIGGSTSSDLIAFASGFPVMDLSIFTTLNPSAVKVLSVQNIKDLLGNNVLDIDTISNSTVIKAWVAVNSQLQVNSLGLNATAGISYTAPNGFITIQQDTQTSGAEASRCALYLLLAFTLVALLNMDYCFL